MSVFIYHYLGLSLVEPIVKDLEDATPIYVGIAVFGLMMTVVIVLLLRLDWAKILGKFLPWTLDENNDDDNDD